MTSAACRCLVTLMFCALLRPPSAPRADNPSDPSAPTRYMVILTGSELLSGIYADSHLQYITRTLGPLGCQCAGALVTGDIQQDLHDALHYAAERVDLIIVTGGLGPTDADVTRPTLSEFTGIPLQENPEALQILLQRFNTTADKLRENLRRQTLTPTQGTYLPNPEGTAVGLVFDNGKQVVIALPGPPRELQPMVKNQLIPYLAKRFGIHTIGSSVTMRFVGIGESNIDEILHKNMTLPENLIVSFQFELSRVDLTFGFSGHSPEDRAVLKDLQNQLLAHIGEYMYSDTGITLEEHVIDLLEERNQTLITAEVGSGGALAASLNHAEGAKRFYTGGYVAPSARDMAEILQFNPGISLEDPEYERKMTLAIARKLCGHNANQWSMAVSQILDGGKGNRYVWLAYGSPQADFAVEQAGMRDSGKTAQARLVDRALDLLRRKLKLTH